MALKLTWKATTTLPVDGSRLRPDLLGTQSTLEVSRLTLRVGNADTTVGDLFVVEAIDGADALVLEGDLTHVRGMGKGMAGGLLVVRGDAGPMLGAEMRGGVVDVEGSVDSWAGAEMRGGLIRIVGGAGDFLGAAFPGSRRGMNEGIILVGGSVGEDAGLQLRRGVIAIQGDAGAGLGRSLIAGTILVGGRPGRFLGAGMKRGSIVLWGEQPGLEGLVLPTFPRAGVFRSTFLLNYAKRLSEKGFTWPIADAVFAGPWERYNGDLASDGRGEILVRPIVVR